MEICEIKEKLKKILKHKRYIHSLNVSETAVSLAKRYGADVAGAELAGILHDCAKNIKGEEQLIKCEEYGVELDEIMRKSPELIHSVLGEVIAREEYKVTDEDVLKSIRFHTTGCAGMSLLDKIIFVADYIEPGRVFDGVERARELAYENIDEALLYSIDMTIKHVLEKGNLLHIDTIHARNYILMAKDQ